MLRSHARVLLIGVTVAMLLMPPQSAAIDPRFASLSENYGQGTTALAHDLDATGSILWYSYGAHQPIGGHALGGIIRTPGGDLLSDGDLAAWLPQNPSAFFLIGGETNYFGQDDIDPASYATALHGYAPLIKSMYPNALIVGPNVLNFATTCIGCSPYESGQEWTEAMVASYESQYGAEPPIDVWGIHAYSIDWSNEAEMADPVPVEQTVSDWRAYVDTIPGQAGKPIWLTEFGVLNDGSAGQAGIDAFVTSIAGWVQSDGPALGLGAAFPYISECPGSDCGATPVLLMSSSSATATLTTAGQAWANAAQADVGYTMRDFSAARLQFGHATDCEWTGAEPCADIDGDGRVTITDISLMGAHFDGR